MRFALTALTVILFGAIAVSVEPAAAQSKKLKPINSWTGKSRDNAGLKLRACFRNHLQAVLS